MKNSMEAKLVKHEVDYYCFLNNKGEVIADVNGGDISKLSLKNCEAIANGYDLDELIKERFGETFWHDGDKYFKEGFQKALEILGDKKFSEEQMFKMFTYGHALTNAIKLKAIEDKPFGEIFNDFIQSLQQTEWDVKIEMICPHPMDTYRCGLKYGCDGDGCNHPNQVPYLDADGCLILKRK